jgi:hypothetical protein
MASFYTRIDHNIGFQGKRQFPAENWRNLPKIVIITELYKYSHLPLVDKIERFLIKFA